MAGMNTRLNIEKLDENIVQKHGGSKQVGFKQLAPGVETGVHRVSNDDTVVAQRWLEDKQSEEKTNTDCLVKEKKRNIRLGGRSRRSGLFKVFWAEDTTRSTYLVNRSPSSAIGFKKPIDMLGFFVGKKLWRLDEVTSKVVLYRKIGFNESGEYKKTFIGSGVDMGSMQNVNQGAGLQEVQTQDLMDYQLARDREQHLACELFGYREYSNEATFAAAVVDKIYAHESLTFNDTFACKAISKWKAELKEDMDVR
ncbi:hypothetical protein Tco_0996172 [Tanacetum coccineum]